MSSSAFVLSGIVLSAIALLTAESLVSLDTRRAHNELVSFAVTNIAVVYAVLLAFIAVAAWEDLSKAADLVAIEAGVVQNLGIDAQGFSDKELGSKVRNHLQRYVKAVLEREWPKQQAGGVSTAGFPVLRRLRATLASSEPKTAGDGIVMQESLRALNDLFTARRSRIDAAGAHIPDSVWWAVAFLGLLTIGFTALLGTQSLSMHFAVIAGLTTAIVVVIALIVQLDYPFRGTISVSPEPFEQLMQSFGTEQGADASAMASIYRDLCDRRSSRCRGGKKPGSLQFQSVAERWQAIRVMSTSALRPDALMRRGELVGGGRTARGADDKWRNTFAAYRRLL